MLLKAFAAFLALRHFEKICHAERFIQSYESEDDIRMPPPLPNFISSL